MNPTLNNASLLLTFVFDKLNLILLSLILTPVLIFCVGLICYGLITVALDKYFDL